ncbi:MAG: cupin domain-containing protein [Candidatus Limnocylindria bacterium]
MLPSRFSILSATNRRVSRTAIVLAVLAAAAITAWALIAPNLVHGDHGLPHGTILTRGSFVEATDIKIKSTLGGEFRVMHVQDSAEVIVQNVTIQPGAQTGWHSHHGPVVVVVAAGTMTLYQADDPGCTGETFTAGDVFVDPGQGNVHIARNEGGVGVSLYATFFDVPPGAGPALPASNPGNCSGF